MAKRKNPAERPGTPISNRNFLAPTGFKFSLKRCPSAAFFCNQANIPSLDLGIAQQTSYLKDLDIPGDKIVFEDLSIVTMYGLAKPSLSSKGSGISKSTCISRIVYLSSSS